MTFRILIALSLTALLAACGGGSNDSPRAVPAPPANNPGGPPVTSVITARFDPAGGTIPTPNNLLLQGTTDLTLNIPVANPNNFGDPTVALNALDGWSTVAPWSASFSAPPAPASVTPGGSVRMFKVRLSGPGGAVIGIDRELAGGVDFVTAFASSDATGRTLAIVPLKPLAQISSYMVVLTNGIADAAGNVATPDQTYFITKRTSPLVVNGVSTEPLLSNAQATALEPLRQLVNFQEAAAAGAGIPRENIVLSWVATTQSITPVMQTLRATTQPGTVVLAPTGLNIQQAIPSLPPIADIVVGFIELPYYLTAPTAENPTAPLNTFWKGAACGTVAACGGALGANNPSTFLTFLNTRPLATGTVRVPVLMTVPNAASGRTKPANGWPLVIFQHGITRNRSDGLAISATLASQGFAMVSIDQPLHGITPADTALAPFRVNNTPFFAAGVRERTFDVDFVNNATGAPEADGNPDASGTHSINLSSLLTSRDNTRQAIADLFVLRATVPNMSVDGDATGDFDNANVSFVGQSLGSMVGTGFVAFEPTVNVAVLSVPGGGIAQLLNGSPTFGPVIRAGLAGNGVIAGTAAFDRFMGAAQQAVDSADPVNFAGFAANKRILLHEVVGGGALTGGGTSLPDQVIPNAVAGAPLAGTEPLIRAFGFASITGTTANAAGVRGAVRFIQGNHGSILQPGAATAEALAATVEMQGQMASFLVSGGTAVQVANPTVIRTQ
ncbi:MAG: hypothetical protein Q8L45_07315 [Xanthomonadaceae bacterium]|nr:hypothetical protein [Xanthomonadaceae bacterium]MDZ4378028.1 hypothetical protein [Xanthomonadaceae bacterium]